MMFRAVILVVLILGTIFFAQSTIDNNYFTMNLVKGWQLVDTNRRCTWKTFYMNIYQDIRRDLGNLLTTSEFSCSQLLKYSDKYELLAFTVKLKKDVVLQVELLYTEDKSYEAVRLPAFEYSDLSIQKALGAYISIEPPVGLLYKFFILFPKGYHGDIHVGVEMLVFSGKEHSGLVEHSEHYTLTLVSNKEGLKELIAIYEREIERLKRILGE